MRRKTNPPPVFVEDKRKGKKATKRCSKKPSYKENKEPGTMKEMTKHYPSLEVCRTYDRSRREIYEVLHPFVLTPKELEKNHYPSENCSPRTEVPSNLTSRLCIRCNEGFEIFKGVYLATTNCQHHPQKASFNAQSMRKIHACCNHPIGAPGCTVSNRHVTLQHPPKPLNKTASKRHIRKDLQHRIFSLDCEMSYTTAGLEVTKIGLVDIDGRTVYESYVKPENTILDYNTLYSGVEKRHLQNIKTTLDQVINILNMHIHEDTILIGHALNNDLAALGLIHNTVIDTSVMYPDPNHPTYKKSLKSLAYQFLKSSVQDDPAGHDCIEDARTALQLALLKVPYKSASNGPLQELNGFTQREQPVATVARNQDEITLQFLNMLKSSSPRELQTYWRFIRYGAIQGYENITPILLTNRSFTSNPILAFMSYPTSFPNEIMIHYPDMFVFGHIPYSSRRLQFSDKIEVPNQ